MAPMRTTTGLWALAGLGALVAACTVPATQPEVSGRALFEENCTVCHGPGGRGDGPAAAGLTPAPPDLTLLSRANGGVFPRVRVMSYIDGYTRDAGHGAMPGFGDALADSPMVMVETGDGILTPTPAPLVALADHLERLQR